MVRTLTFVVLMLSTLAACGGPSKYVVVGTARASGADGVITVERTESNNLVTVTMENLTPPGRVREGATVYAVWFRPDGQEARMQGVLEYDTDDRTGTFQATTPENGLEVIVSAELDNTVISPSDVVIIRQEVAAAN